MATSELQYFRSEKEVQGLTIRIFNLIFVLILVKKNFPIFLVYKSGVSDLDPDPY
jgi:hypothetical protein